MTEKTASPARACRNIENGFAGSHFGVMVAKRSALIAFFLSPVSGVRYFDRDACVVGCGLFSGVVIFEALIATDLGPGTEARFVTDLLRRRDFNDFSDPTIETF